jgi:hypothetical protein
MSLRTLFRAVSMRSLGVLVFDKNDGDVSETSNRVVSLLEQGVFFDEEESVRVVGRA